MQVTTEFQIGGTYYTLDIEELANIAQSCIMELGLAKVQKICTKYGRAIDLVDETGQKSSKKAT